MHAPPASRGRTLEDDTRRCLLDAMAAAVVGSEQAFRKRRLKAAEGRCCARCGSKPPVHSLVVDSEPGGRRALADAFLQATALAPPQEASRQRLRRSDADLPEALLLLL